MASPRAIKGVLRTRPHPPAALVYPDGGDIFVPAMEIDAWARKHLIEENDTLYNREHEHLRKATIGWLWTSAPNAKAGIEIVGLCEMPNCTGNRWLKRRVETQLERWFGIEPRFLITLYAPYIEEATDAMFCAVVEHELYHAGQARDVYGDLKFTRDGDPVYCMRGHDVEEHLGIVRRYGAGNAAGKTAELVRLAGLPPEIAEANIARACGTCL